MDTRVERGISGVSEMTFELVVLLGICIVIGVFAIKMRRTSRESKMTASMFLDKGGPFAIDEDGWENPEKDKEKDERRE